MSNYINDNDESWDSPPAPSLDSDSLMFLNNQYLKSPSPKPEPFDDDPSQSADLLSHPLTSTDPPLDENGQPIKIRKKPGRKPNPASPALRKAQNRAAQRAFRERKEKHLRDLETTIRTLRDQKNNAVKELHTTKSKLDAYKAELWYLKGTVLTLQFVCLHHNIFIPTHSPYLTEETLSDMAKTAPHAVEAYVNAYTRNNAHLKPTMASHISNNRRYMEDDPDQTPPQHPLTTPTPPPPTVHDTSALYVGEDTISTPTSYQQQAAMQARQTSTDWTVHSMEDVEMDASPTHPPAPARPPSSTGLRLEQNMSMAQWLQQQGVSTEQIGQVLLGRQTPADPQPQPPVTAAPTSPLPQDPSKSTSLSTLQRIRLQLRIQHTLAAGTGGVQNSRLQPTILQLAIPHDPRIDLIPTTHMRDRLILFRDQIDYDHCFDLLLNGTKYLGGDPTLSENWDLDPAFIQEYWYLMLGYDVHKTNRWRRARGLPELPIASPVQWQYQHPFMDNPQNDPLPPFVNDATIPPTAWADDVIRQMVEGMPSLQPVVNNNFPFNPAQTPPPPQPQSPPNNPILSPGTHPFYTHLLGTAPDARGYRRSPSIGAMMKLMDSLSTNNPGQRQ
ncbi:hypothetical protein DM01DRAFT_1407361 [Hesseltinella vesiculosa]|uniref:BZIP domain-containing protein n=1 Tax=Hesseltinella vesiculosa TaxID=101127 RepID=A0A1X2GIH9_9FUNG|nr:hypothetical protein DM01DRAFT_1407361 [Hesseltinella vesiculosa]